MQKNIQNPITCTRSVSKTLLPTIYNTRCQNTDNCTTKLTTAWTSHCMYWIPYDWMIFCHCCFLFQEANWNFWQL